MDPQSTWEAMLEAIAVGNLDEATEKAEALLGWLDRKGFPPQTLTRVLPVEWDRKLCRFLCRQVLAGEAMKETKV